jgi:hypothetical protein
MRNIDLPLLLLYIIEVIEQECISVRINNSNDIYTNTVICSEDVNGG